MFAFKREKWYRMKGAHLYIKLLTVHLVCNLDGFKRQKHIVLGKFSFQNERKVKFQIEGKDMSSLMPAPM